MSTVNVLFVIISMVLEVSLITKQTIFSSSVYQEVQDQFHWIYGSDFIIIYCLLLKAVVQDISKSPELKAQVSFYKHANSPVPLVHIFKDILQGPGVFRNDQFFSIFFIKI